MEYARKHGPVLIEALTYRYMGHGVSDRSYDKRAEELSEWKEQKDPITVLAKIMTSKYKNVDSELGKIEDAAQQVVEEAVEFALNSPNPTYEDLISNIYVTS